MNENLRYLYIILAAVLLMAAGLFVSYRIKMNRGVRATESNLTLSDLMSPAATDSVVAEADTLADRDTIRLAVERHQREQQIYKIADTEGFRWQTALQKHRFREPAEALLINLEQEGAVLRDSLGGLKDADVVLPLFDQRLATWQQRLSQQTQLLPTALQALEAQQISDREYQTVLNQVAQLEKKRK